MIQQGTWVKIQRQVLPVGQRAPQLPEDTKQVPFLMWAKGFLVAEAEMNSLVTVKTITGRLVEGTLTEVEPTYQHNYGTFIPELLRIGADLRRERWGGADDE
ncbi:2-amino-4-oxopentanoate thiolase subunit OrtA [Anoxynatronum sibiricum]|uniref:2-amino-4-oxopentanoate thiolase subunit OrtA n=1 Tax=Anoxynatronum sibiricum TaxID=210623 RepID=A0ABU9VQ40_9CLOT